MTLRRVHVEKLAPTGEGVTRGTEGVGFIEGALPGEDVDVRVIETRRSFWRGRVVSVVVASPDRRPTPAEGCGGCDWAHYEVAAARRAKRELFLETMGRIGRIPASAFGELPIQASPLEYRLRNRFHGAGRGDSVRIGAFAPRSHQVMPVSSCAAVTAGTRQALEQAAGAIGRSGLDVEELATLENRDGVHRVARVRVKASVSPRSALDALATELSGVFQSVRLDREDGRRLSGETVPRLTLEVEGRRFSVAVDVFFQSNRFVVEDLYRDVRELARSVEPGESLDAFGGVGLLAGALRDAGHEVVSVEGDAAASREASRTRAMWPDAERWQFVSASVASFLSRAAEFPLVVVDPPRAGLGSTARPLARIARKTILYASCDPATLARDLSEILGEGFSLRGARLYDMFPLTHRVEALVSLERA